MIITTGIGFDNYEVVEYLGIVCAQEVLGTGFLSETSASIADFFGTKSSGFENKYRKAQQSALRQLQDSAADLGANAIIAIDIDIDTLANNAIVVLTNGTAVKIREKIVEDNVESRVIPVVNYSIDSSVRIGQAVIIHNMSSGTYFLKLRGCATSKDNLPVGLQVKVDFLSRFGTSLLPISLDFIQLDYNRFAFETNVLEIKGDVDLSTISSLKVFVEKYIDENESIVDENFEYKDVTLKVGELNKIKTSYGIDAVCQTENKEDYVLCNCGRIIPKGSKRCEVCGRKNVFWTADGQPIDSFIGSLYGLNSGKEVLNCIVNHFDSGDAQLSEYRKAMIQAIELEQSSGKNMKEYAIKKCIEIFGIPANE